MLRSLASTAAAAAIVALATAAPAPAHAQAVPGYMAPDYQKVCMDGLKKLELGVQVIGASQANITRAQQAHQRAADQASKGAYYPCSTSVKQGLDALDAG
jgi:Spy/CpxP family protein refolding chaperone